MQTPLLRYRGVYIPRPPSIQEKDHEQKQEDEKNKVEENKDKKNNEDENDENNIEFSVVQSISFGFFDLSAQAKAMRELEKMLDTSDESKMDGKDLDNEDSDSSSDDDNFYGGSCFDDDGEDTF